jgi:hypothetical protein
MAPGDAEPVTVKDGIIHIGKDEAIDFDTGEPIKVAADASDAQIKQALRDGGALSKRQKFFGGTPEKTTEELAKAAQASAIDQAGDITLTIPTEQGDAKMTVNARTAMNAVNKRLEALEEVRRCLG